MNQAVYAHSQPVPLRTHKKSSNGCRACKERKVKCDEQKPVCRKCQVHFSNIESCDWRPAQRSRRPNTNRRQKEVVSLKRPYSQSRGSGDESSNSDSISGETLVSSRLVISCIDPSEKTLDKQGFHSSSRCRCPCHEAGYTDMMLDAIFGICRICGNHPGSTSTPKDCRPVMSDAVLRVGRFDPFSILPEDAAPRMHSLMHHWVDVLALFPTKINSQYCTNQQWITQAISNPVLFNLTLYVSAIHEAVLHGKPESFDTLYYKSRTIWALNEALKNPSLAIADETMCAVVLLIHVITIIGDEREAKAHMRGLQQMVELRGGIENYLIDGVFLHMLCTTNHLAAVLSESHVLRSFKSSTSAHPASKLTRRTSLRTGTGTYPSSKAPSSIEDSCISVDQIVRRSPLLKPFGISSGFHTIVVDIFHEMGYLYFVLDAFTNSLLPMLRSSFEELIASIKETARARDPTRVVSEVEEEHKRPTLL